VTKLVANRVTARRKSSRVLAADELTRYNQVLRLIRRVTRIVLHSLVVSGLLLCLGVEFDWFWVIFSGPFVDFQSWGFGQIVGITIWVGAFLELAYLEYSQSYPLLSNFERD
jgi:hypothetical protein